MARTKCSLVFCACFGLQFGKLKISFLLVISLISGHHRVGRLSSAHCVFSSHHHRGRRPKQSLQQWQQTGQLATNHRTFHRVGLPQPLLHVHGGWHSLRRVQEKQVKAKARKDTLYWITLSVRTKDTVSSVAPTLWPTNSFATLHCTTSPFRPLPCPAL